MIAEFLEVFGISGAIGIVIEIAAIFYILKLFFDHIRSKEK